MAINYGVATSWDGSGLNPFQDYIHNGEEHILINSLKVASLHKFYSVKGRGINFDFAFANTLYDGYDLCQNPFFVRGAFGSSLP